MFSEKTKDLAKQFRFIEEQLADSIKEDFKSAGLDGALCTTSRLQVWFDQDSKSYTKVKDTLPVEYTHYSDLNAEHLYFNVGDVPFVTVLINNNKGERQ